MFGGRIFQHAWCSVGIQLIIGQEFYITNTSRHDRVDTDGDFGAGFHLTVIANNAQGYSNLVKLSSMAYTQGFYYKPRIDYDILGELNEGLFVLSGCLKGEIPQKLLRGDVEGAKNTARKFLDIFWHRIAFL